MMAYVLKKVNTLYNAKASQQYDIPTKIFLKNQTILQNIRLFYENINQCICKSTFPSDLKLADVTPVYKKKSKNSKDNYRPVSILSNISKIYERFTSILYCPNINVGFVEATTHNTAW